MIIEDTNKHLTDQEFYTFAKFIKLITEKKEVNKDIESFNLYRIILGTEGEYNIFSRIFMTAQVAEIPIHINKYFIEKNIENINEELRKKSKKEQENILKIIKKIQSSKTIKIEDVADLSWVWYEVYDCMLFCLKEYELYDKMKEIFEKETNNYINNFIDNKLTINDKNYYRFELQKHIFINKIEEDGKINLYGNNFILQEEIDKNGFSKKIPDFCILQTAFAMKELGYLDILDFWEEKVSKEGIFDEKTKIYLNININIKNILVKEINAEYKKNNPEMIIKNFDTQRGILKFANKDIEISKKNKETDAVLLLKTLIKEESSEWKYNDEILTDWGYHETDFENLPKNKTYFAAQKLNNTIELETGIKDFIEYNTTKARINPKYRKIDE